MKTQTTYSTENMSPKIYIWTNPHPRSSQVAFAFDDKAGKRHIRTIKGGSGLGELIAGNLIKDDLKSYEANGWA